MKVSIVIADGYKQIMMTPQTDHEKEVLKYIEPNDTLEVVQKKGTFDDKPTHYGHNVSMAQGGYLRRFAEENSLMFVIQTKPVTPKSNDNL